MLLGAGLLACAGLSALRSSLACFASFFAFFNAFFACLFACRVSNNASALNEYAR